MISIDNCTRDLGGELLCQLTERSLVKIRVLGRSETPECECHLTLFATGNNILLKGDMVRRGLVCTLDALSERPELRSFQHDPLKHVLNNREAYVAAALTITRAYLAAGAPRQKCGPLGSYPEWSRMVRSPLVWLGELDPVESMNTARAEDPELNDIRELFELWPGYFDLDERYTTGRIIEVACEAPAANDFNRQPLKDLLQRAAGDREGGGISAIRLGWWLRGISGRIEGGLRLNMGRLNKAKVCFWLAKVEV
jgi:putative DNA primase/helicase